MRQGFNRAALSHNAQSISALAVQQSEEATLVKSSPRQKGSSPHRSFKMAASLDESKSWRR